MTDGDKGWVYEDGGVYVYRASSLGNCTRSLVAARMGESAFPFNERIRAAMDESSELEEKAIAEYRRRTGHDVIWQQKRVELLFEHEGPLPLTPENLNVQAIVRGHIDGLDQQTDEILEVKCMSGRNFANYDMGGIDAMQPYTRKYKTQAAFYGHATGRKVRFVVYNKHAEDDKDLLIWEESFDPEELVPLDDIFALLRTVEEHARDDELPDCDANCREGDPYSEAHFFESVKKGDEELRVLLRRYQEIRSLVGSADKGTGLLGELEDIKERVKTEYGVGTHAIGPFTAKVVHKKGSERIDTKRLKKERPDIAEEYKTFGAPSVQLTVSGEEEAG